MDKIQAKFNKEDSGVARTPLKVNSWFFEYNGKSISQLEFSWMNSDVLNDLYKTKHNLDS